MSMKRLCFLQEMLYNKKEVINMKQWFALLSVIVLLSGCMLGGCAYDKDGDAGYVPRDEYVLPTDREEKGSVPYVVAKLIAAGQVVRDYNELQSEAIGAIEAYSIRTNGINVEFYRFDEDSQMLAKIKELGAYPVMNEEGEVLSTLPAVINKNVVMMIPSNKNAAAMDITEMNERLIKRFKNIRF